MRPTAMSPRPIFARILRATPRMCRRKCASLFRRRMPTNPLSACQMAAKLTATESACWPFRTCSGKRAAQCEAIRANLYHVALEQVIARDPHAIDEGAGRRTMILYFLASILYLPDVGI